MTCDDQLPGFDQLRQRHDLMVQLYRVDDAAEAARRRQEGERLAELEALRSKLESSLVRLSAA